MHNETTKSAGGTDAPRRKCLRGGYLVGTEVEIRVFRFTLDGFRGRLWHLTDEASWRGGRVTGMQRPGRELRQDSPGLPAHSVKLGMTVPAPTTAPSATLQKSLRMTRGPCAADAAVSTSNERVPGPRTRQRLQCGASEATITIKHARAGSLSAQNASRRQGRKRTMMQPFPISTPFPIVAASTTDPAPIVTRSPIFIG